MNFIWNAYFHHNIDPQDYIDEWNNLENPILPIYEYLGFRKKEYYAWLADKSILKTILDDKKKSIIGIHIIKNNLDNIEIYLMDTPDDSSFFKIISEGEFTILYKEHSSGNITSANHTTSRWKNGYLHHDTLPSIENPNGMKAWYKNGNLHKNNGPAFIYPTEMNKPDKFFLIGIVQ